MGVSKGKTVYGNLGGKVLVRPSLFHVHGKKMDGGIENIAPLTSSSHSRTEMLLLPKGKPLGPAPMLGHKDLIPSMKIRSSAKVDNINYSKSNMKKQPSRIPITKVGALSSKHVLRKRELPAIITSLRHHNGPRQAANVIPPMIWCRHPSDADQQEIFGNIGQLNLSS